MLKFPNVKINIKQRYQIAKWIVSTYNDFQRHIEHISQMMQYVGQRLAGQDAQKPNIEDIPEQDSNPYFLQSLLGYDEEENVKPTVDNFFKRLLFMDSCQIFELICHYIDFQLLGIYNDEKIKTDLNRIFRNSVTFNFVNGETIVSEQEETIQLAEKHIDCIDNNIEMFKKVVQHLWKTKHILTADFLDIEISIRQDLKNKFNTLHTYFDVEEYLGAAILMRNIAYEILQAIALKNQEKFKETMGILGPIEKLSLYQLAQGLSLIEVLKPFTKTQLETWKQLDTYLNIAYQPQGYNNIKNTAEDFFEILYQVIIQQQDLSSISQDYNIQPDNGQYGDKYVRGEENSQNMNIERDFGNFLDSLDNPDDKDEDEIDDDDW